MAVRRSVQNEAALRQFGSNLVRWRKTLGLTQELTAERAGITRATLRSIERGEGTARMDNLFMVLRVLGQADAVLSATDPLNSELGRMLADERLPQRVRRPKTMVV